MCGRCGSVLTICVFLLLGMFSVPSSRAAPTPSDTSTEFDFPQQAPSHGGKASPAPELVGSEQVTSTGEIALAVSFRLPPSRNGHVPTLGLSYSSADAQRDSAAGAGWLLPVSSVKRNTRFGMPPVALSGGVYRYRDEDGDTPIFSRDGIDLAADRVSPRIHAERCFVTASIEPLRNLCIKPVSMGLGSS
jgi:hypothetical protein